MNTFMCQSMQSFSFYKDSLAHFFFFLYMYVPASLTQELASYHERDYYMFAIFTYGTHQGPLSTYWFFSFFLYFQLQSLSHIGWLRNLTNLLCQGSPQQSLMLRHPLIKCNPDASHMSSLIISQYPGQYLSTRMVS